MQARLVKDSSSLDYTPATAKTAGDVVVVGTIPLIVERDIAATVKGTVYVNGVFEVVKDSSTFADGDAVYWNATGNPVGGVAGSGAATSTASGANLMGWASIGTTAADFAGALTGDATMRIVLTSAKRTATLGGSVGADDLTGTDASLSISGLAAAAGGAVSVVGGASSGASTAGGAITVTGGAGGAAGTGGAVTITGGVPVSGNAAGGAAVYSAGAGSGTGAGGTVTTKGGGSGTGATGNGGAWTAGGGAALSTNGTGGAASLTGGVATGTGTGGAVTITSGASAGASGTAGAVAIDTGAAAGGTGAGITIGGTNATSITLGKMPRIPTATVAAAGTIQGDAAAIVEGFTLVTGSTNAGVILPSAVAGMQVIVKNNVAGNMKVWPNTSDAVNAAAANAAYTMATLTTALFVAYDATTWYTLPLVAS